MYADSHGDRDYDERCDNRQIVFLACKELADDIGCDECVKRKVADEEYYIPGKQG